MDEIFDIVTKDDIVTHQVTRTEAHARGLWHRGVHVFLFDNGGRLLVQKRSADRKQYPSLLDCSVSEHVKSGEIYPDAARRGLMEELGVDGIELQFLVKFRMVYGPNDNEISMVYQGVANPSAVKFDPVEIDSIQYIGPDELKKMMSENREDFCGWFVEIMNWVWGKPGALTVL
jgi:isopentenyl-diphosphate delta-isomerase type 1